MVAQLTIRFPFVGRRGECSAGSGACEEGNLDANVGILQTTGDVDDDKQAEQ
jgi:hypothetical protein